ncbi:MAG TPA: Uma2 family endonuclease [Ktedonobacteraceae bacterium]|nr:Uma2 family endonuclease [Ktedonobacteraceae bacterium]
MTTIENKREITTVTPADWVPGPRQGHWTYEAYAALPNDGHKYEVVQGVLMMSPAPEPAHQGVIEEINGYLREQIRLTKRGLVLTGPVDVVLSQEMTMQPDVLVLLAEHINRVQKKRILGVPDLAVEVMSPSSATYDRFVKYSVYERAGVPEYWLVNVDEQTIEVFVLDEGKYRSLGVFQGEQTLPSRIVPGMSAPVAQFFDWTGGLL